MDTILASNLRRDKSLLLKFSSLLSSFTNKLPIKTTHLIWILSIFNKGKNTKSVLELCLKFDYEDLESVDSVLIKILDIELHKNKLTKVLKLFQSMSTCFTTKMSRNI